MIDGSTLAGHHASTFNGICFERSSRAIELSTDSLILSTDALIVSLLSYTIVFEQLVLSLLRCLASVFHVPIVQLTLV